MKMMEPSRSHRSEEKRKREFEVLRLLESNGTPQYLASKTGIGLRTINNYLDEFEESKYVEKLAPGLYGLTEEGRQEVFVRAEAIKQDAKITESNYQMHVLPEQHQNGILAAGSFFADDGFKGIGAKDAFARIQDERTRLGIRMAGYTKKGFSEISTFKHESD